MSAQVIPFRADAARRVTRDVQTAWDAYHSAAMDVLTLMENPAATSEQRRDASLRALRLHRIFCIAAEGA